jgi:uncharacterized protein (TIGR00255 family)
MLDDFLLLKSMTAYGRGVCDSPLGRVVVDIQSVNRRFLEVTPNLPRLFVRFEMEVRKMVTACIGRGMVTIAVDWIPAAHHPIPMTPNLGLAQSIKGAWEKLAKALNLSHEFPLMLLTQEKNLFLPCESPEEESAYAQTLYEAIRLALEALLVMKREEGVTLGHDIHQRLETLQKQIDLIEAKSGNATEKYRQRLKARLDEFLGGSIEKEDKILLEIAAYAEKVDITEEIVRFKSHLEKFEQTLDKPLDPLANSRGKTLDFFLQELLRESNTIGSKASDKDVIQCVVHIKSELERIREQVQNIE